MKNRSNEIRTNEIRIRQEPSVFKIISSLKIFFFQSLVCIRTVSSYSKVEKKIKGSLDSPSPSVKIQIMGGKVCLRCKDKTFENKKFVDIAQQFFIVLTPV